jgi:radical SAM protein with 4Fe4S-binding SPASM domain
MKDLTKITYDNIKRKDFLIEESFNVCNCCGLPLPSWIEISPIDFCTRRCIFCPKGTNKAPNQRHLVMHPKLISKIALDLSDLKFQGTVMLAGYGEPMVSPYIMEIIQELSAVCRVELTTNGDLLTEKNMIQMNKKGLSSIIVSVYEGPEQFKKIEELFKNSEIDRNAFILRDRWYDSSKDFGIKLTNRAGTITIGNQPVINKSASCFYPHYSMTIDWNGDVLLCPQEWHRQIKCGNLAFDSIHDVWTGPVYNKYRKSLYEGSRKFFPCSDCNCAGTVHGRTHAEKWHEK